MDTPDSSVGGITVWLTGLPAAGKTTIADSSAVRLSRSGILTKVLDGDALRTGINRDLGFSRGDRAENARRIGEIALLLAESGFVTVVASITPYEADRYAVRERHRKYRIPFIEAYVSTPLSVCEARDPKGLYHSARSNLISDLTGASDPYEIPIHPELTLAAGSLSVDGCVELLIETVLSVLGTRELVAAR